MINRSEWLEDLQKNVSELIAKSPAADIERNVKAFMSQAFNRMDLVTREEFDTYKLMLERALARVAALETRLQALEGRQTPVPQDGDTSAQEGSQG
ncbi:accessory factor UbiK family protein [Alcaligenes faecalis]|uniref:accessory factor UbiK family protein n=1 Tax=Alcaligenes faecalis TaxID=511 RepID=UPI002AA68176|nr:accessory factor UbiK family protein [Alcaligenes faecalis]